MEIVKKISFRNYKLAEDDHPSPQEEGAPSPRALACNAMPPKSTPRCELALPSAGKNASAEQHGGKGKGDGKGKGALAFKPPRHFKHFKP